MYTRDDARNDTETTASPSDGNEHKIENILQSLFLSRQT